MNKQVIGMGLASAFLLLTAQTCSQQTAVFTADVIATVDQVQQITTTVEKGGCNVLPTIETVGNIIAAAAGQGVEAQAASAFANAICAAVTAPTVTPPAAARAGGSFAGVALPPGIRVCTDPAKTKCTTVIGIYTK